MRPPQRVKHVLFARGVEVKPGASPRATVVSSNAEAMSSRHDHDGERRALELTLATYSIVFVAKLGVFWVTHVMAVLAEALHTLSDVFVSAFLLAAAVVSRKERDEDHPFGHGRAQFVGALVAATLFVSFTSFELVREAIPRLLRHDEVKHEHLPLALGVLTLSMLAGLVPMVALFSRRPKGASAKAQLTELVNDQLGLVAALVATFGIMAGHPIADPIGALFVAAIIAANGVALFRENASYLLGRAPDRETLATIEAIARDVPGVNGSHGLRAQIVGPGSIHAEVHVEVDPILTVGEGHRIAYEVQRAIGLGVPGTECVVHIDVGPPADDDDHEDAGLATGAP